MDSKNCIGVSHQESSVQEASLCVKTQNMIMTESHLRLVRPFLKHVQNAFLEA